MNIFRMFDHLENVYVLWMGTGTQTIVYININLIVQKKERGQNVNLN